MFPIGDSPNPRGIAWVTYALIAINVLAFVLYLPAMGQAADPSDPRYREYVETLGKEAGLTREQIEAAGHQLTEYDLVVFEHGSRPADPSFLDMLKSMFLHGGFMHLFGNMLFLWIYGNNAEFRMGRILYLLAYLATGYAAAFGDMLLRPGSNVPAVGASGAISGVLGMYFIWFPHNKVRLLVLIPPVARVFELGARWVLGFYIVANNLLPVLLGAGGPSGVAYGAHIAGFVGGVLVAIGDNLRVRRKREPEETPEEIPEETPGAAHLRAARVLLDEYHQPTAAYQRIYEAIAAGLSPEEEVEARALLRHLGTQVGSLPQEATRW